MQSTNIVLLMINFFCQDEYISNTEYTLSTLVVALGCNNREDPPYQTQSCSDAGYRSGIQRAAVLRASRTGLRTNSSGVRSDIYRQQYLPAQPDRRRGYPKVTEGVGRTVGNDRGFWPRFVS